MLFPTGIQFVLMVSIFSVGMGSMLLRVWFEAVELWGSFRGVSFEDSIYQKKVAEQSKL